jgi:Mlc titration factor MtfA (ptsG expression regulator)
MDGMPPLHRNMSSQAWIAAFQRAYDDLRARLERDEEPWLDPYAAEDPAEFFAVCSEMFFDLPDRLRSEYPDVYAELAAFYRQSPAAAAERRP